MAKVEDRLLEHSYDGIQEYDNPLPSWWVYLFILTIVWSFFYVVYYHVLGIGPNQHQEYLNEFKVSTEELVAMAEKQRQMWDEIEFVVLTEPDAISNGEEIYKVNCASCHGNAGEGGIGPNLADNYHLHGAGIENVMRVIINGVPEKGMIAWRAILKPDEVKQVASYVLLNIEGTSPQNPKAPQGDLIEQ